MFGFRVLDANIPLTCADVGALYLNGEEVFSRAVWAFVPMEPDKLGRGRVKLLVLDEAGRVKIAADGTPVFEERAGEVFWTRKGEPSDD